MKYPDLKGFNRRGLYRMKQFFELYKDDEVVEFALSGSLSPTMVSEYTLKLTDKNLLQKKLKEYIEIAKEEVETNEKNEKRILPVFGVGPIYVISCLILTIGGLALDYYGFLEMGKIHKAQIFMYIIGIFLIIGGITLWIKSVLFQKIGAEVKKGNLITTGVYSIVRNPIYSAFLFIFTGILFLACNLYLLLLPFIFWIYLTILIKCTEEKWLKEKFGDEYMMYLQKVNRVIPWFRKK